MSRTKKSNFQGSGYQKNIERITILENSIKEAIEHLDNYQVKEAKATLLAAWIRETNL